MTDKEKLEAIIAELRRLKKVRGVYKDIYKDIFAFYNSLPSVPASEDLDLGCGVIWKGEEPKKCMYSKDNYTDEDRKALCDGCKEECKFNKKEEPVSEDLEQAIDTYLATYFGGAKEKQDWPFLKQMAIHFAAWQKEQLMAKAIDGEVGYWNLRGLSVNVELPHSVEEGDKYKVILIKED